MQKRMVCVECLISGGQLDGAEDAACLLAWDAMAWTSQWEHLRLHENTSDAVRVGIAGRSPVLEVPVALGGDLTRDADRCAAVGNATAVMSALVSRPVIHSE